jgi:hypothetical protein
MTSWTKQVMQRFSYGYQPGKVGTILISVTIWLMQKTEVN